MLIELMLALLLNLVYWSLVWFLVRAVRRLFDLADCLTARRGKLR